MDVRAVVPPTEVDLKPPLVEVLLVDRVVVPPKEGRLKPPEVERVVVPAKEGRLKLPEDGRKLVEGEERKPPLLKLLRLPPKLLPPKLPLWAQTAGTASVNASAATPRTPENRVIYVAPLNQGVRNNFIKDKEVVLVER